MDNSDFVIYDNRNFTSLVKGIVESSETRREQILLLIDDLRSFIKGPGDVPIIAPYIKEYLSVASNNDANLTKLANVLTRMILTNKKEDDAVIELSEEEKRQLFDNVSSNLKVIYDEESAFNEDVISIKKRLNKKS